MTERRRRRRSVRVFLQVCAPLLLLKILAAAEALAGSEEEELMDGKALHKELNRFQQAGERSVERNAFAVELLKTLHEQYGKSKDELQPEAEGERLLKKHPERSGARGQPVLTQLLNALNADGDVSRLLDWVRNSFSLASLGELTTQFAVGRLASVNCAALFKPDAEQSLMPRFLLFNEHFPEVPFELPPTPSAKNCPASGPRHFDPLRKTVILLHGYLGGYTIIDGLTNIKDRILDLNGLLEERARAAAGRNWTLSEEEEIRVRVEKYNVLIVDWFGGANPVVRSRYIRAAVNAQVVGSLIGRFLSALVQNCRTPASKMHIIAHSLGCHVAGFAGKAMQAKGLKLGKITHLDPIGLCFGRLFSEPSLRLRPSDAHHTQAVHVSLNLFDNPLDGAHENFLVNGGRDQLGCGGQSELKNSTSASVSLLFDSESRFGPCSHMRALALFEDDHSSRPEQCQIVGYKCPTYDAFLAGKCALCDHQNNNCRLMTLPALRDFRFERRPPALQSSPMPIQELSLLQRNTSIYRQPEANRSAGEQATEGSQQLARLVEKLGNGSIAWVVDDQDLNHKIGLTIAKMRPEIEAQTGGQAEERADKLEGALERLEPKSLLAEHLASWAKAADQLPRLTISSVLNGKAGAQKLASALLNGYQALPEQLLARPAKEEPELEQQPIPLGGQALPAGASNGPLYFVGTSSMSPYCVNYYQFRMLVAESRINNLFRGRAANKLASNLKQHSLTMPNKETEQQPVASEHSNNKDMLHLTVKLVDSDGHFFKGFSLLEDARTLKRIPLERRLAGNGPSGGTEKLVELTMLLNSTKPEPVRITETIVSYYFHAILLADSIQVNYMSNISPEIRAKFSSNLCPLAINDKHQLVKYVECDKTGAAR